MPHKLTFNVIYATSEMENHKAIELTNHNPACKGWQSGKFSEYPQYIIISLEHRCQIKKIQLLSHQYLIATKIEFFVGDCPNDSQLSVNNARFTRLGYVSLSDNEKTQFKARELKSVHVDSIGRFIKFVIHSNFFNKLNCANQVGLIAINVIGDEIYNLTNDQIENFIVSNKHESILPTEDLAFDMSIDPETAQIIRNLEKLKLQAVEDEQFDKAQKIFDTITYLQKVGEKLGKLEIEKRSAIKKENYDLAKQKKEQIDQYRYYVYKESKFQEFVNREASPIQHKLQKYVPESELYSQRDYNQNNNAIIFETPKTFINPEDRPLPSLKNQPIDVSSPRNNDLKESIFEKNEITSPELVNLNDETDDGVIPGMTKSDLSEASDAIEIYGLPLVSKVYCKNWSYREDALLEIEKRLKEMPVETDKEDVKSEIRAASCLIKKAFKSRITQVVQVAMDINKLLLTELVDRFGIAKPDVHHYLDKISLEIFKCIEDNKVQIRDMTFPYLIEMSQWEHVKQFPSIFHEAIKPISQTILAKPGVIKSELLLELYSIHGLSNHNFTLDNFMKYTIQALQHKSAELRESAETLIVVLYRNEDKQIVRSYLPPDDMKIRKNVLYKRLFEKLDKIDGVDHSSNNNLKIQVQESLRQREIEALQIEQQQLKDQLKSKPVYQTNKKVPVKSNLQKELQSSRVSNIPKQKMAHQIQTGNQPKTDGQEDLMADLDKTCIFCGEKNDALKDNMDLHYWKNCPILRRCPHCKQAVEISSLTQHLLQECEQKSQFGQCPRCTEAILKSELDQHITDVLCNPADVNNSIRCPLCHENISLGPYVDSPEALWQFHLMDESNGCPQNPRRLVAIQRQHQQNDFNTKTIVNQTAKSNNAVNRKSQLPRAKGK